MNFVEPIRQIKDLNNIREQLKQYDYKYYLVFEYGITSGLRISDVLKLTVEDLTKEFIGVREKKTGKFKKFPMKEYLRKEMQAYCKKENIKSGYVFRSPFKRCKEPIGRCHVYRVFKMCAEKAGYYKPMGTHTCRKTFGYHFYNQTKDIVMLQKIFNHSSPAVTLSYIGITQEKINEAYKNFIYNPLKQTAKSKIFCDNNETETLEKTQNQITKLEKKIELLEQTLTECMNYGFEKIEKKLKQWE